MALRSTLRRRWRDESSVPIFVPTFMSDFPMLERVLRIYPLVAIGSIALTPAFGDGVALDVKINLLRAVDSDHDD